jgi:hypothetical protein
VDGYQHSYRLRHPSSGKEIKATTIPLEDKQLGLIAFLCVNIDIHRLSPDSQELRELARNLVATPGGWGKQVFDVQDLPSPEPADPLPARTPWLRRLTLGGSGGRNGGR